MEYYANTDAGLIRSLNEDSYLVKSYGENKLLAIIADGMGGHNAGEKASRMAVDEFCKILDVEYPNIFECSQRKKIQIYHKIATKVNEKLYSFSMNDEYFNGMGTTLIACLIFDNNFLAVNIGDSRLYQICNDSMKQITKDHSYVAELLEMGVITPEQAINHPKKNIITRAVGSEANVEADVFSGECNNGSYLLLCTDGLINMVNESEIEDLFRSDLNVKKIGNQLIDMANAGGGKDNITVILVKI